MTAQLGLYVQLINKLIASKLKDLDTNQFYIHQSSFDKKSPKNQMATRWMYENFPISTADKQVEYELLTASNIDWTLVRLPLIEQTDEQRQIQTSLEDCEGDKISATDLAHFLIIQLTNETFIRQAPFLWSLSI